MPTDVPTLVFREWGQDNGFRRKGTTLYRDQVETIAVVNLQGSRYGGRYYVNVALWLKAVGDDPAPKENKCHLRTRLAELRPGVASERDEVYLNLNSDVSDDERRKRFRDVLDSSVTPALAQTATLADLKANPSVPPSVLGQQGCLRPRPSWDRHVGQISTALSDRGSQ